MRILCTEPEGEVWREVKLLDKKDLGHVVRLADKLATVPNFLNVPNPYSLLFNPYFSFFEVDDVGVLAFNSTESGCTVHITFWDRRLRGREGLCREMATLAAALGGWNVRTSIPASAKVILAFAKRVGFAELGSRDGIVELQFIPKG